MGGAGTLSETTDTLTLSGFTLSDMGMYRCEVTNDAGTGMDSINIEFGGQTLKPELVVAMLFILPPCAVPPGGVIAQLSPSGPLLPDTTSVDLMCEATTGRQPISYSWTGASGVAVFPDDTDGNIVVTFSTSGDYGTCIYLYSH